MQIHIRTPQGQMTALEVQSDDTVLSVKKKIQNEQNTRVDLLRLFLKDTELDNTRSLASYGVVNGSTLRFIKRKFFTPTSFSVPLLRYQNCNSPGIA